MITTKIGVEPYVAEYIRGKYYDETVGAVRFPRITDVYVLVYDLLQRRPDGVVDSGNLEFALPDRRTGSVAGGKSPEVAMPLGNCRGCNRAKISRNDVGRVA